MILKFLDKYLEKMLKPESFANNLGISIYIYFSNSIKLIDLITIQDVSFKNETETHK